MIKLKGLVRSNKIRKNGKKYDWREFPNLLVDDGIEYILDGFAGRKSWHNPSATASGVGGLLTFDRYAAPGLCMFNNSSEEARSGKNGVSGGDFYPITSTVLVSPEDSFLSREVGSRVKVTATRVDQTVEFTALFSVPGDIPSGTEIREFGLFLQSTGPTADPSQIEAQKPYSMLCRVSQWESGVVGVTGVYLDNPIIATDDIEILWKFGELPS